MMSDNHKTSECGFGESLVAYLYDEIEPGEKTAFERHLEICPSCADELADFRGVHFSINQWKAQEFSNLVSPSIEVPQVGAATGREKLGEATGSWLDGLRGWFSALSAWSTVGAALAVVAIFGGFALFIINSGGGQELADKSNQKRDFPPNPEFSPVVSPSVEKSNQPQNEYSERKKAPQTKPDLISEPPGKTENTPVKASQKSSSAPKIDGANKNSPKNNRTTNRNAAPRPKAPSLSPFEDEEEETLRLADLFSEIDAR